MFLIEESILRDMLSSVPNLTFVESPLALGDRIELEYRLVRTDALEGQSSRVWIKGTKLPITKDQIVEHFRRQLVEQGFCSKAFDPA